jgi:hypothetical protein
MTSTVNNSTDLLALKTGTYDRAKKCAPGYDISA